MAVAREIVAIMKTLMAGRSYSVRYIIRVNQVFSGSITTDAEWKSMYGRPTSQSIKRYVEKFNESLEPDGANSHIGRRGAIFGGVVIDQTTGDVVVEWTDRNIIRFYTSKPAFEVASADQFAKTMNRFASIVNRMARDVVAELEIVVYKFPPGSGLKAKNMFKLLMRNGLHPSWSTSDFGSPTVILLAKSEVPKLQALQRKDSDTFGEPVDMSGVLSSERGWR